jgi:hypothetical protein
MSHPVCGCPAPRVIVISWRAVIVGRRKILGTNASSAPEQQLERLRFDFMSRRAAIMENERRQVNALYRTLALHGPLPP